VHQQIIDWDRDFSPSGVPARAVGLTPPSLAMMRVMMRDWRRMSAVNRFFGGTLLARLEMDILPGLSCAAHFAIAPIGRPGESREGRGPALVLRAGAAVQRFWLTAARLGLVMQPSLATLCFASYGRSRIPFCTDREIQEKAGRLATALDGWIGARCNAPALFIGRIGVPRFSSVVARSVRHPIEELMIRGSATSHVATEGAAAF
jgi:hypothetical protein